ncbi:hypothetical protein CONPUDRAFT_78233 [Coniophora puteana RWD-64-598 SS2]|uniref:Uncharacterized protein n=1 Tax=Coniophora puteana (strain RWD-64-598) TaxID=741705 RepID=R7SDN8_CONPW|nr:uncharacterized protein CONPUDRAFT_78233 [Coniophora puteana RWD-64-598 SS2]EIW74276.1 hypothetical protein CONPUDRAFT_78233 [Coniophora puteana RWD-64-598 SS2]
MTDPLASPLTKYQTFTTFKNHYWHNITSKRTKSGELIYQCPDPYCKVSSSSADVIREHFEAHIQESYSKLSDDERTQVHRRHLYTPARVMLPIAEQIVHGSGDALCGPPQFFDRGGPIDLTKTSISSQDSTSEQLSVPIDVSHKFEDEFEEGEVDVPVLDYADMYELERFEASMCPEMMSDPYTYDTYDS